MTRFQGSLIRVTTRSEEKIVYENVFKLPQFKVISRLSARERESVDAKSVRSARASDRRKPFIVKRV